MTKSKNNAYFKTRVDFRFAVGLGAIPVLSLILSVAFLPNAFLKHEVGWGWCACLGLMIVFCLSYISNYTLKGSKLTKSSFFIQRSVNLHSMKRYVVKEKNYNLSKGLASPFRRRASWRIFILYFSDTSLMKIDERTMSIQDFNDLISHVKRQKIRGN